MFKSSTKAEIIKVAQKTGLNPAALMAVAWVESAGRPYWRVGGANLPAIRFEGHYFYRILKRKNPRLLRKARRAGLAHPRAGRVKNPRSYQARYELLARAKRIDHAAAIESTSWGLGQVMGAHWRRLGYSSPQAFEVEAKRSIGGQVMLMAKFILKNNLKRSLNRRRWGRFARRYNGPGYRRNRYHTKMARAYRRLRGSTAIMQVQADLRKIGYASGNPRGNLDKKVLGAIKRFQRDNGLVVDGDAGPMTREAISEAIDAKHNRGKDSQAAGLGGAATGLAVALPRITDALEGAEGTTTTVQRTLENIGMPTIFISVAVAAVIGLILWNMIKHRNEENQQEILP